MNAFAQAGGKALCPVCFTVLQSHDAAARLSGLNIS
jgi:hypothetical protein